MPAIGSRDSARKEFWALFLLQGLTKRGKAGILPARLVITNLAAKGLVGAFHKGGQRAHERCHHRRKRVHDPRVAELCRRFGCKAKVFIDERDGLKGKIGTPDLVVLFTCAVSHNMVETALCEARRAGALVERSHSASASALRDILSHHCARCERRERCRKACQGR